VPDSPGDDRVAEIISHERQADDLSAQSDGHRWEAARLISEELPDGKSQRQLAAEIGKHHSHVQRMAKCWTWRLKSPGETRTFNQVYNSPEVRGTGKPESDHPGRDFTEEDKKKLIRDLRKQNGRPDPDSDWDDPENDPGDKDDLDDWGDDDKPLPGPKPGPRQRPKPDPPDISVFAGGVAISLQRVLSDDEIGKHLQELSPYPDKISQSVNKELVHALEVVSDRALKYAEMFREE
jgi:hypothetical protein